jgi:hypothetical protein
MVAFQTSHLKNLSRATNKKLSKSYMKALIFFVLTFQHSMVELWKMTTQSLLHFSDMSHIDILVITCGTFVEDIKEFARDNNIHELSIITLPRKDTCLFDSRLHRFRIHEYKDVSMYDTVMYMDYDCIVHMCLWANIFNKFTLEKGILYSYKEAGFNGHNKIFYGFGNYTHASLMRLKSENVYPFSTGIFMFKPCRRMKRSFGKLEAFVIDNLNIPHFYEQSGANVYFNNRNESDTSTLKCIVNSKNIKPNMYGSPKLDDAMIETHVVVTHFCGIGYHPEKMERMAKYFKMAKKLK